MLNALIVLINYLVEGAGMILVAIISILPSSPFTFLDNSFLAPYLSGLNWLVPIDYIISVSTTWLTCVGLYYLYQIGLRWLKAIE